MAQETAVGVVVEMAVGTVAETAVGQVVRLDYHSADRSLGHLQFLPCSSSSSRLRPD